MGQLVRRAREAQGLTVAAAANRAGIAKAYLSMIENHRVGPPSARVLAELARALGLDGRELSAAAAWQTAPPVLHQALARQAEAALRARDLARWLREATHRKAGGGRNLDRLFRSGELRRRVEATLATRQDPPPSSEEASPLRPHAGPHAPVTGAWVPIINKVAAGYPAEFTDLGYPVGGADEWIVCPDVHDPDAFAARVIGDSMAPDYREGDIVVFSPLADLEDGCDCYARLEPDHEATFKRVYFDRQAEDDPAPTHIRLVAINRRYPARVCPREQVAGLYRAVWLLRPVGSGASGRKSSPGRGGPGSGPKR